MNGGKANSFDKDTGRWQVRGALSSKGMTLSAAYGMCRLVGADLPKYGKKEDKANTSYGQCADSGDIQSPI
jgi:hypothetical protein